MKAVVHRQFGEAKDVLEYVQDFPVPTMGEFDLLVKNKATSVNPIDCAVRKGYGREYFKQVGLLTHPHIPGRDVVGEVIATGSKVTQFSPGDVIWAGILSGGSAEYVAVPESWAALKPSNLSWIEAGTFPYAGLTAWTALVEHVGLNQDNCRGKKVIIPRGAGGVGSYAIQLMKAWGAEVATIVSTRNIALVESLGADIIIDYTKENFSDILFDYDVAFDTSFGIESKLLNALKTHENASYVSIVTPKIDLMDELGLIEGGQAGDDYFDVKVSEQKKLGRNYAWSFMKPNQEGLITCGELFNSGAMNPIIDSEYTLENLASAHERCESGKASGKIVVTI